MHWEKREPVCLSGNVSKRMASIWEHVSMDSCSEVVAVTMIQRTRSLVPVDHPMRGMEVAAVALVLSSTTTNSLAAVQVVVI